MPHRRASGKEREPEVWVCVVALARSAGACLLLLAECRGMGIEVQVPDVNRSASDFTPLVTAGEDSAEVGDGLADADIPRRLLGSTESPSALGSGVGS